MTEIPAPLAEVAALNLTLIFSFCSSRHEATGTGRKGGWGASLVQDDHAIKTI